MNYLGPETDVVIFGASSEIPNQYKHYHIA